MTTEHDAHNSNTGVRWLCTQVSGCWSSGSVLLCVILVPSMTGLMLLKIWWRFPMSLPTFRNCCANFPILSVYSASWFSSYSLFRFTIICQFWICFANLLFQKRKCNKLKFTVDKFWPVLWGLYSLGLPGRWPLKHRVCTLTSIYWLDAVKAVTCWKLQWISFGKAR